MGFNDSWGAQNGADSGTDPGTDSGTDPGNDPGTDPGSEIVTFPVSLQTGVVQIPLGIPRFPCATGLVQCGHRIP